MLPMYQKKRTVSVNDGLDRESNAREINANFHLPVSVKTNVFDWQGFTKAGIRQRSLERLVGRHSRLTAVAQFAAGQVFKKIAHEHGVEFLVLSGKFSDEHGDYGVGSYVRNPAAAYRMPFTRDGCTVLLKVGRFQLLDQKRVVVNTRDSHRKWKATGEPGVSCLDLHQFSEQHVSLHKIRAECWITFKCLNLALEIFVIEGDISVSGSHYEAGTWLRYPPGSRIKVRSKHGCCLYINKNISPE